ncbi:MAG TPA: hypothetical protein VG096_23510 [Bryobacteraceae bacterium]|nr:hypothetical protein [Bryobacteraceae bacterium]
MQPTEEGKKRILVVEDERLIAVDLQTRLERLATWCRASPAPAKRRCDAPDLRPSTWS